MCSLCKCDEDEALQRMRMGKGFLKVSTLMFTETNPKRLNSEQCVAHSFLNMLSI